MLHISDHTCLHCGGCVPLCPTDALLMIMSGITCNQEICILCGDCVLFCPVRALEVVNG